MKTFVLKNTAGYSINELTQAVQLGGSFIIYHYSISIIALSFKLTSTPYFIKPGESKAKYRTKYTLRSLLFGWWGFPWGPVYTFRSIRNNAMGGGQDITDEVMNKLKLEYPSRNPTEPFEKNAIITYLQEELVRNAPKHNHVIT